MSQKEILALFAVIDPNDLLQLRDLAIFELLYGSGMRIGDALNLKSRDLFLDHEELGPHVRAVCKGNIECVIPLAQASLPVLKLYRLMHQPTGEKLFHNRNSPAEGIKNASSIGVRWRHYLRRANLPNKYTMHMLRHSAATHLYANGMAIEKIQLILGHSSLRPTQLYTLVTPKQLFSAHLKADIRGLVEQHMRTSK
jgi:site-specific recombinase XerD